MNKEEFLSENRIYAIVTSTVKTNLKGVIEMEKGRMAAQACHVVSRLKLFNVFTCPPKERAEWLKAYTLESVTTIILQARDQNELEHVVKLAIAKGLNTVRFSDKNKDFYMSNEEVLTAIAIGPTSKLAVNGICDYLPLFG